MKPPLLQIQDLSISFRSGTRLTPVVRQASLTLEKGRTLALVGESGSGKTITAMSILRLLPESAVYPDGKIFFNENNTLTVSDKKIREIRGNQIGVVFQQPMTSLNPLHRIGRQLMESVYIHQRATSAETAKETARFWLDKVGLKSPEKRINAFPHELSGGERQRVMIAMALINQPDLLIADEPTTALDVTVQAQILALIKNLQDELGMAILFITHDLGIVRQIADQVAVMKNGRIVETSTPQKLFSAPDHPYTRKLIHSEPTGQPDPVDDTADILIRVNSLKVWFPLKKGILRRTAGYVKAVDGISFFVKKGHTLGIVGESGSGKSSAGFALLKLIPSVGTLLFGDHPLNQMNPRQIRQLRKRMQMIFQDPFGSLNPRMSVEQIISEGLDVHLPGLNQTEKTARVIDVMETVGLDPDTRQRYPNEFSGGQHQRIAIARALILKPEFMVLDEPTSSLDRSVQFQVLELLKRLQKEFKLTYIFISHDLKVVRSLCHDVIVMKDGVVVESGPADTIFHHPDHPYTRTLMATAFHNSCDINPS